MSTSATGYRAVAPYLALEHEGALRAIGPLYVHLFVKQEGVLRSLGTFWAGAGGLLEVEPSQIDARKPLEDYWEQLWSELDDAGFDVDADAPDNGSGDSSDGDADGDHGADDAADDEGPLAWIDASEDDDADLLEFFVQQLDEYEPRAPIWLAPELDYALSLHERPPERPPQLPADAPTIRLAQGELDGREVWYLQPPPPLRLELSVELELGLDELRKVEVIAAPVEGGAELVASSEDEATIRRVGEGEEARAYIEARLDGVELDTRYAVLLAYHLRERDDADTGPSDEELGIEEALKDQEEDQEEDQEQREAEVYTALVWDGVPSVTELMPIHPD